MNTTAQETEPAIIGRGFHHFTKGKRIRSIDLPLLTEGTVFLGEFTIEGKLCRNTYIVTRLTDSDRPDREQIRYARYWWPSDIGAVTIQPAYPMAFWQREFDDERVQYYFAEQQ